MGDSSIPFADAAKSLLRSSVLDSLRSLLMERDWARISVAEVARVTGVSRQTIYNEFVSRTGLAKAYAQRVIDNFVLRIEHLAEGGIEIDFQAALEQGFLMYFADLERDPVIRTAREGEITGDVARLLTVDADELFDYARERLTHVYHGVYPEASGDEVRALAATVVQVAGSYVLRAPRDPAVAARDHSRVFAQAIHGYLSTTDVDGESA